MIHQEIHMGILQYKQFIEDQARHTDDNFLTGSLKLKHLKSVASSVRNIPLSDHTGVQAYFNLDKPQYWCSSIYTSLLPKLMKSIKKFRLKQQEEC